MAHVVDEPERSPWLTGLDVAATIVGATAAAVVLPVIAFLVHDPIRCANRLVASHRRRGDLHGTQ